MIKFLSEELSDDIYCPQTKLAKVMFLHLSVSHSVHGGGSASVHSRIPPWEQTPPQDQAPPRGADPPGTRHPPPQCMLGDTVNKRAVRVLLERNLVTYLIYIALIFATSWL